MRSFLKRLRQAVAVLRGRSASVNLDAFASSQTLSKQWLVEKLEECLEGMTTPPQGWRIWILGGWYGLTNFILRTRAVIDVEHVRSLDIDPECQPVADRVNKLWEWQEWQFKAQTCDVNKLSYNEGTPHIVINTSVEHIAGDQWYKNIPQGTLVVLQANDQLHDDHIWICSSPKDLLERFGVSECLYEGSMEFKYPTGNWSRHMIIAIK
jgi:hypothetical protein